MARSVASASASRARSSSRSQVVDVHVGASHVASPRSEPSSTRSVLDMSPMMRRSGGGRYLDERRRGDDLLAAGQRRLLIDVDDLEVVAALRVLLADRAHVLRRRGWIAASCR